METLYDVLRALVRASRNLLTEEAHNAALAVIDKHDPGVAEAARAAAAAPLSDQEKADLERLRAREAAAAAPAAPAEDPNVAPPAGPPNPPPAAAVPGAGFNQVTPAAAPADVPQSPFGA